MAIEIIKHGKGNKKYIATCCECECQFSFQKEDVEEMYFNWKYEECVQLHCPECRTYLTLPLDDLPTKSV